MARKRKPIAQRFWSKVSFGHGPDACWLWKAHRTQGGYGKFLIEKTPKKTEVYAHRYVLRLLGREGEETHHTCNNKECVNPAHLVAMTEVEHKRHHAHVRRGALGQFSGA